VPSTTDALADASLASDVADDDLACIPAIVMMKEWSDRVFSGEKSVEIRVWRRRQLGKHIVMVRDGGELRCVGYINLLKVELFAAADLHRVPGHCVKCVSEVPSYAAGKSLFAWHFDHPTAFPQPFAIELKGGGKRMKIANLTVSDFPQHVQEMLQLPTGESMLPFLFKDPS
jgi:hypothetical protein